MFYNALANALILLKLSVLYCLQVFKRDTCIYNCISSFDIGAPYIVSKHFLLFGKKGTF